LRHFFFATLRTGLRATSQVLGRFARFLAAHREAYGAMRPHLSSPDRGAASAAAPGAAGRGALGDAADGLDPAAALPCA
jgi:hypothetical protein